MVTSTHKQRFLNRLSFNKDDIQIIREQEQKSKEILNKYQKMMVHFYVKMFIKKLTAFRNRFKSMTSFQIRIINNHLNEEDDNINNSDQENPFYSIK